MIRVFMVSAALCCSHCFAQQPALSDVLGKEGHQALNKQRLERTKQNAAELSIDAAVKERLIASNNQELLQAALKDQTVASGVALEAKVRARTMLNDLGALASDNKVAASLTASGIDPTTLRTLAASSQNPQTIAAAIAKKLGTTKSGKIVLKLDIVLITKPELVADDNLPPGKKGPGQQADDVVWRSGMKFAALIGTDIKGKATGFCSGTVVGGFWVVTAAHCLLDSSKGTMFPAEQVGVFLPFQDGNESVTAPNGFVNRNMRRVGVQEVAWLGEVTNDKFPNTEGAFSKIILDGKDLALLRLKESDIKSLPATISGVTLYSGLLKDPPVSAVGYGITDATGIGNLGLLVGVRNSLPEGVSDGADLLTYGPNKLSKAGGTCGGDSGGGLFAGRIDGQATTSRLIGVVSSLVSSEQEDSASFCLAQQQSHTSLITKRNREFVCIRAPAACA